jgi:hypothetical protein
VRGREEKQQLQNCAINKLQNLSLLSSSLFLSPLALVGKKSASSQMADGVEKRTSSPRPDSTPKVHLLHYLIKKREREGENSKKSAG